MNPRGNAAGRTAFPTDDLGGHDEASVYLCGDAVAGRLYGGAGPGNASRNPDRFNWNSGDRSIECADVDNPAIGRVGDGIAVDWRHEWRVVDQSANGPTIAGRNLQRQHAIANHHGIGSGRLVGGERRRVQHAVLVLGFYHNR